MFVWYTPFYPTAANGEYWYGQHPGTHDTATSCWTSSISPSGSPYTLWFSEVFGNLYQPPLLVSLMKKLSQGPSFISHLPTRRPSSSMASSRASSREFSFTLSPLRLEPSAPTFSSMSLSAFLTLSSRFPISSISCWLFMRVYPMSFSFLRMPSILDLMRPSSPSKSIDLCSRESVSFSTVRISRAFCAQHCSNSDC